MAKVCRQMFARSRRQMAAIVCMLLYIQMWLVCLIQNSAWTDNDPRYTENGSPNKHVQFFPEREWKVKEERLILVWTPMFLKWIWVDSLRDITRGCASRCAITTDRSRIQEVDAVLFHMFDLWFWLGMPRYRHPSQVWIIWCGEPPTRMWRDYRGYEYTFNWTMHYRRDSTIESPFAMAVPLPPEERREKEDSFNRYISEIIKEKVNNVAITNSDCYDEVQRYRLVDTLRQHVPVDFYGNCGNLSCPRGLECNAKIRSYKFTIQFENSYCNDYITEKYWQALAYFTVPIVNWKPPQQRYPVIQHSYINVFDFPDLKSAAEYIKMVANNDTLYKGYFKWRTKYKLTDVSFLAPICYLCDALHDKTRPAQVIRDMQAWIEDDSCEKGTVSMQEKCVCL